MEKLKIEEKNMLQGTEIGTKKLKETRDEKNKDEERENEKTHGRAGEFIENAAKKRMGKKRERSSEKKSEQQQLLAKLCVEKRKLHVQSFSVNGVRKEKRERWGKKGTGLQ